MRGHSGLQNLRHLPPTSNSNVCNISFSSNKSSYLCISVTSSGMHFVTRAPNPSDHQRWCRSTHRDSRMPQTERWDVSGRRICRCSKGNYSKYELAIRLSWKLDRSRRNGLGDYYGWSTEIQVKDLSGVRTCIYDLLRSWALPWSRTTNNIYSPLLSGYFTHYISEVGIEQLILERLLKKERNSISSEYTRIVLCSNRYMRAIFINESTEK